MATSSRDSVKAEVLRTFCALGVVAAITFLYFRIIPVNATTVALTFLTAVLAVAARWGFPVAALMSVAAMFCLNFFFLPPVGTLAIADPQNWVALLVFLITSLVASHLSHTAIVKAGEALRRQHEVERLYELSRILMLAPSGAEIAYEISHGIARVFDCDAVSYYDRTLDRIHHTGQPVPETQLRDTALHGTASYNPTSGLRLIPVSLGGKTAGALAILGGTASEAALQAAANLAAIALEKQQAQAAAAHAEAAQESEKLKSTLLDAIAHELKTPLTSILAASTTLIDGQATGADAQDLLSVISEETERLAHLISNAIHMARIEGGKVKLKREPVAMAKLLEDVLAQAPPIAGEHPVSLSFASEVLAQADPEMLTIAFRQLIGNAAKYSAPDKPISISVTAAGDFARVTVTDHGPGIDPSDQARIFEKFFRAPSVRERIPGAGMGLAIARDIVRAHGGEIGLDSVAGQGASFWLTVARAG